MPRVEDQHCWYHAVCLCDTDAEWRVALFAMKVKLRKQPLSVQTRSSLSKGRGIYPDSRRLQFFPMLPHIGSANLAHLTLAAHTADTFCAFCVAQMQTPVPTAHPTVAAHTTDTFCAFCVAQMQTPVPIAHPTVAARTTDTFCAFCVAQMQTPVPTAHPTMAAHTTDTFCTFCVA